MGPFTRTCPRTIDWTFYVRPLRIQNVPISVSVNAAVTLLWSTLLSFAYTGVLREPYKGIPSRYMDSGAVFTKGLRLRKPAKTKNVPHFYMKLFNWPYIDIVITWLYGRSHIPNNKSMM